MQKLLFVTGNVFKVEEMQKILNDYKVRLIQKKYRYIEDQESSLEEICRESSKDLSDKFNQALITEDTGIYFDAYRDFPGVLAKPFYNGVGFEGIFKLLDGKSRKAYMKTVIGYCAPNSRPKLFTGVMKGEIIDETRMPNTKALAYDKIFIPDGYDKTIVEILGYKHEFSHRAIATHKLGKYINSK